MTSRDDGSWRAPPKRAGSVDAVLLAVLANRFESIVREMTNTLFRTGRSAVLNMARDFSCSIVTADDELLAAAEGLQVHVLGAGLQTRVDARAARRRPRRGRRVPPQRPLPRQHPHRRPHDPGAGLRRGRARVHRLRQGPPGRRRQLAARRTYMPFARDVYEEGGAELPLRADPARLRATSTTSSACAGAGSASRTSGTATTWRRSARRGSASGGSSELVDKYGRRDGRAPSSSEWLDYSERRMGEAIARLPAARLKASAAHDPMPGATRWRRRSTSRSRIDPDAGRIEVDLRDNIDCLDLGINLSRCTAMAGAADRASSTALDSDLPAQRRQLPPHRRAPPRGQRRRRCRASRTRLLAGDHEHPRPAHQPGAGGVRPARRRPRARRGRRRGRRRLRGLLGHRPRSAARTSTSWSAATTAAPARPTADGWLTYAMPRRRDDLRRQLRGPRAEVPDPRTRRARCCPDTGAPAATAARPASVVEFGPSASPMLAAYTIDGHTTPARGARGGGPGSTGAAYKIGLDGSSERTGNVTVTELLAGERIRGEHGGGGGYGTRSAARWSWCWPMCSKATSVRRRPRGLRRRPARQRRGRHPRGRQAETERLRTHPVPFLAVNNTAKEQRNGDLPTKGRNSMTGEDLERRVARLEAREEIGEVMAEYLYLADRDPDADKIAAVQRGCGLGAARQLRARTQPTHGREAIRELFAGLSETMSFGAHYVTNPVIEIDEDLERAHGRSAHAGAADQGEPDRPDPRDRLVRQQLRPRRRAELADRGIPLRGHALLPLRRGLGGDPFRLAGQRRELSAPRGQRGG